jgi:hypothetical protein
VERLREDFFDVAIFDSPSDKFEHQEKRRQKYCRARDQVEPTQRRFMTIRTLRLPHRQDRTAVVTRPNTLCHQLLPLAA